MQENTGKSPAKIWHSYTVYRCGKKRGSPRRMKPNPLPGKVQEKNGRNQGKIQKKYNIETLNVSIKSKNTTKKNSTTVNGALGNLYCMKFNTYN